MGILARSLPLSIVASVLLGLLVALVIHLALDGSVLPERGTGSAAVAGLAGIAVALAALVLLHRWWRRP